MEEVTRADLARATRSDTLRAVAVLVTAVSQVASAALIPMSGTDTGELSDANRSPITPAGYAFAIWGLIYLVSLALAVYQLLPSQRVREVHRRTGWWLVGGFAASTVWVPIFNSGAIGVSQLVILALLGCLLAVAGELAKLSPASSTAERFLLRLPVATYLGWAILATAAGFGTTFRSLGMPEEGGWVTAVSLGLLTIAVALALLVATRITALAGFTFTAGWALVAIVVGTYVSLIAWAAVAGLLVVITGLAVRTARSDDEATILLG